MITKTPFMEGGKGPRHPGECASQLTRIVKLKGKTVGKCTGLRKNRRDRGFPEKKKEIGKAFLWGRRRQEKSSDTATPSVAQQKKGNTEKNQ